MGNCFGKQSKRPIQQRTTQSNPGRPQQINDLGNEDGVEPRIVSCEESIHMNVGNLQIRYGYMSQRGYYPDDENKPNQDSFSISTNFNNSSNDALFSVYDGHGRYGDQCAHFARDHLPNLIERHIRTMKIEKSQRKGVDVESIELTKEETQSVCAAAHKQCNMAMHKNRNLDDALSGTTAISCFLHGRRNRITICNVGDSRAVLGQRVDRSNGKGKRKNTDVYYRALPLSRDQTPYRRDERKRIRAFGARILSLDQIEGLEPVPVEDSDDEDEKDEIELGKEIDEDGDPPRVWHPHQDYPGTAFTRSLGDQLAEELGVYAEPEMVTRELEDADEIIVLASDGVFEFLTNQSVIDICAKFKDPLAACRAVVAESYELWLQYELRTDDITMVCIFIDSKNKTNIPNSSATSFASINENSLIGSNDKSDIPDELKPEKESRPVRSRPSVEKSNVLREMSKASIVTSDDVDFDVSALYTEKTAQEKAIISQAIKASVMLQNMTDTQRDMIYGVMEPIVVNEGDWIIRQGTVGDKFYIVEEGTFEVRIVPEGQEQNFKNGGILVHVYEGSIEKSIHPSFGELALLYNVPRAATIVAKTKGKLWALHKNALRKVLVEQSGRQELLKVLKTIDCLKSFNEEEKEYIAGTMEMETFGSGKKITVEGNKGSILYVISKGQCEIFSSHEKKHNKLSSSHYFGHEVMMGKADKYSATVKTASKTTCWKLERQVLIKLKKQFESVNNNN